MSQENPIIDRWATDIDAYDYDNRVHINDDGSVYIEESGCQGCIWSALCGTYELLSDNTIKITLTQSMPSWRSDTIEDLEFPTVLTFKYTIETGVYQVTGPFDHIVEYKKQCTFEQLEGPPMPWYSWIDDGKRIFVKQKIYYAHRLTPYPEIVLDEEDS